jgi:hypothetical protein
MRRNIVEAIYPRSIRVWMRSSRVWMRSRPVWMRSSRVWMWYSRSSAWLDYQCQVQLSCAGILEQSMGARNRVGKGLSHRPVRLHRLAESIPGQKIPALDSIPRSSDTLESKGRHMKQRWKQCILKSKKFPLKINSISLTCKRYNFIFRIRRSEGGGMGGGE